jgi:hydroxymethylbilane synthase
MIRIATRSSKLALAQAGQVADMLGGAELVEVATDGEAGDKSRFVRGVERALLDGEADLGVHSAKDLPSDMHISLEIAAVSSREDAADVWIGEGSSLDDVPEGTRVGTASLRRRAQLLVARPDLRIEELHGNVDTRLHKLTEGKLDAIVLAAAGLRRLDRAKEVSFSIPEDVAIPAAGQGALILQSRVGDRRAAEAAAAINDDEAFAEVIIERAAVKRLGADCTSPIGVRAHFDRGSIKAEAFVGLPDGSEWLRHHIVGGGSGESDALGKYLANCLLDAGARDLLDRAAAL